MTKSYKFTELTAQQRSGLEQTHFARCGVIALEYMDHESVERYCQDFFPIREYNLKDIPKSEDIDYGRRYKYSELSEHQKESLTCSAKEKVKCEGFEEHENIQRWCQDFFPIRSNDIMASPLHEESED
jgi:hypothetical protein